MAAVLLLIWLPGAALAHAKLVLAEPAADTIVTAPPAQLKLHFSEELDVRLSTAQVTGPNGARVDTGAHVDLNDRTLLLVDTPGLPAGVSTVRWHAVADDDKGITEGSYTITVVAALPAGSSATPTLASQEGALVRASGPRVYWISGGRRHHVPTLTALLALSGGAWNVQSVDDAALAAIPEEAMVVQGSSPDLYLQVGSVKVWLPTIDALKALGYQTVVYRRIGDADLAALPTKNDLVKGSGPTVFVLFNGNRYPLPSLEAFTSRGFLWGDVRVLDDSRLAGWPVIEAAGGTS
jgi:methionine-rich copper-binding protein CopC